MSEKLKMFKADEQLKLSRKKICQSQAFSGKFRIRLRDKV